MRQQFRLPETDELYLGALGLPWETVLDVKVQWLIVHDRSLPPGYNQCQSGMAAARSSHPAIQKPNWTWSISFPTTRVPMAAGIRGLSMRAFEGKDWQQWSRHRTPQNPWRSGEDDIAAHFILVDHWLRRELPGVVA